MRESSVGREIVRTSLFFVATLAASLLARLTLDPEAQLLLVSPVAGIGLIWLATGSPRREWWWDIPALSLTQVAALLLAHGLPTQLLGAVVLAWIQPVFAAATLRRVLPDVWGAGGSRRLSTTRDLLGFLLACAVGAAVYAGVRWVGLGTAIPANDPTAVLMTFMRNLCWALAIGLPAVLLGPLLTSARTTADWRALIARCRPASVQHLAEAMFIVALTATLYGVSVRAPIAFAISLLTVWVAMRFSVVTASLHALLSGLAAVVLTLVGVPVLTDSTDPVLAAALSQAFMTVLVITAATVGLSAEARKAALARVEASEAIAADRARILDTVIADLREGVVVTQSDGTEVVRNPVGRSLLNLPAGLPYDDALPGPDYGVFDEDGRRLELAELPNVRAMTGTSVPLREYLVRAPGAPEGLVLEIGAKALPGETPESPITAVVNFRDVTSERRERDTLTSFAGVVAHDLTNPLSIVDGWAEALREEFGDGPVTSEDGLAMVGRIQSATALMRQFIADLLAYTVARDQALRIEPVDLSDLAEGVALMRRSAPNRPRITVQPDLWVEGDLMLARQLVDNLIGNAIKYVAPGVRPLVTVTAAVVGDDLRVEVSDNGVGVPVGKRRTIFENFQRAHGNEFPGTGIGLAICQRIVERHGGSIGVEDNETGTGSTFYFTLPRALPLPATGSPEPWAHVDELSA